MLNIYFNWYLCVSCRMHKNAGGYDLDNEFFINLATPCKWVSSTVCIFPWTMCLVVVLTLFVRFDGCK